MNTPPEHVRQLLQQMKPAPTEAQWVHLAEYLDLLLETNKQFNLTSVRDLDEAWERHILDSVTAATLLPKTGALADVGSGGGLPGIPLAILRPDLDVALIEATAKKARFLETVVQTLGLPRVRVIQERAETVGQDPKLRGTFQVVTARAVAPLNILLELTLPLLCVGGELLAFKGQRAKEEVEEASTAARILGAAELTLRQNLAGLHTDSALVSARKIRHTPSSYPRLPGTPKKCPLVNNNFKRGQS